MTKTQVAVLQVVTVVGGVLLLVLLEPSARAAWVATAAVVAVGLVGLVALRVESAARVAVTGLISVAVMVGASAAVSFALGDPDWRDGGALAALLAVGLTVGWLAPRASRR